MIVAVFHWFLNVDSSMQFLTCTCLLPGGCESCLFEKMQHSQIVTHLGYRNRALWELFCHLLASKYSQHAWVFGDLASLRKSLIPNNQLKIHHFKNYVASGQMHLGCNTFDCLMLILIICITAPDPNSEWDFFALASNKTCSKEWIT